MLQIENTLISLDIKEKEFVCNLSKCMGACCVEGDAGAPLDNDELEKLHDIYDEVEPYLSEEGKQAIQEQGKYVNEGFDEFSTPLIEGRECAYAIYDEKNMLKCGIEAAYLDKKIDYKKPISCHLYPIRTVQVQELTGLNYDKWSICADACTLGKELNVPVYKFLKEPLIRKFGEDWYKELTVAFDFLDEKGVE